MSAPPAPNPGPPLGLRDAVPVAVLLGALVTVVVGVSLDRRGVVLGTPLPPFLGPWEPGPSWAVLPVAGLFALAVLGAPRLLRASVPGSHFALAVLGLALGLRFALSTARLGADGWYAVFDSSFDAPNEYLPALTAFSYGAQVFLDRFAEVITALPVHSAGHPPGLLLVMHALGIDGPRGLALLVIVVGALTAPLTYALGRQLVGEDRARVAALLLVFAPSALHYGATSADALFATLGLLAGIALVARPAAARVLGALALAVASFFSYALLAVGAWSTLVVARRDGLVSATILAAGCGLVLLAFYALLWALTGFDAVGSIRATEGVYRFSVASIRPYEYWLFGSPAAFLLAMGPPVAWYALRAAVRAHAPALALAAVVVTAALLGFTKAETERIWVFMVPLACVAAAAVLPRGRVRLVLALLAVQAVLVEVLLVTVW